MGKVTFYSLQVAVIISLSLGSMCFDISKYFFLYRPNWQLRGSDPSAVSPSKTAPKNERELLGLVYDLTLTRHEDLRTFGVGRGAFDTQFKPNRSTQETNHTRATVTASMTAALSYREFSQYRMSMSSMIVPPNKDDDCGFVVGGTSLCEAFRIASASLPSMSAGKRERRGMDTESDSDLPAVAKTALTEALRAAAEVTATDSSSLCCNDVASDDQTSGVLDLAPRRPLRTSSDDDFHHSETDISLVRQPSLDSILKTTRAPATLSSSKAPVRRQLSFGATDTVEFDASLPACFAIDRPVTRWRSSRRGLERSHSSDCLPRLPSRQDCAMMAPRRCARRKPEASPRMPQRVATSDDSFSFLAVEPSTLMSPVRSTDSPRSPLQSPTPSSPRHGLLYRMDSA